AALRKMARRSRQHGIERLVSGERSAVVDARCGEAVRGRKQTSVKMLKAGALAIALSAVLSAQQPSYTPPHLVRGDLPSLPPPTVVGGGEVLIEATVDQTGALTRPVVLRTTPPYTNIVLEDRKS